MLTEYRTDDTCATVHAKYPHTTARTTRVLLYTYTTQRPIETRARSLHEGTPAHVYTVPAARLITAACARSYTTGWEAEALDFVFRREGGVQVVLHRLG